MSRHPKFCIIGGGISGLTTAYCLQRLLPSLPLGNIILLEAADRLGGGIQTIRQGHFLFENGTPGFELGQTGADTLGLVTQLNIAGEVILANKRSAQLNYFLRNGSVRSFPSRVDLFRYLPRLFCELRVHPPHGPSHEDESIYSFGSRHLGHKIVNEVLSPICIHTLGDDPRVLSTRAYFPRLWEIDRKFGSIVLGSIKRRNKVDPGNWITASRYDPTFQSIMFRGARKFSLREGTGQLIWALVQQLQYPREPVSAVDIRTGSSVCRLVAPPAVSSSSQTTASAAQSPVKIYLKNGAHVEADYVIAAIPSYSLATILLHSGTELPVTAAASSGQNGSGDSKYSLAGALKGIRHRSVVKVNVGFDKNVLGWKYRGGGYSAATQEKSALQVLGMSWDSNVYKAHNTHSDMTRVGILIGGPPDVSLSPSEASNHGCMALREHLGISDPPATVVTEGVLSLPIYEVGHLARVEHIERSRSLYYPWLHLLGYSYKERA